MGTTARTSTAKKDAREILRLHRKGLTYKVIGARLGVSESNICRFMRRRGYRVKQSMRIVKE